MIWLTWRQHRSQLLFGFALLAAISAALFFSGLGIASTFRSSGLERCLATPGQECGDLASVFSERYTNLQFAIPLFLVLPAFLGMFWGAPMVAREFEQGTHRLAWTQAISRLRWAWVKVAILGASTVAGTALVAFVLSWWSRPLVTASDSRFGFGVFDLRGIVPVAYALFALAVGVAAGTLIRRTVPAMVAGLGVFAAVRIVVELLLRPHFASPLTVAYPMFSRDPRSGLGDWVVAMRTIDGAGHVLSNGGEFDLGMIGSRCPGVIPADGSLPDKLSMQTCIQHIGLRIQAIYQPGSRYWSFQWIEAAIFVALALVVFGFSLWWVRHRVA